VLIKGIGKSNTLCNHRQAAALNMEPGNRACAFQCW